MTYHRPIRALLLIGGFVAVVLAVLPNVQIEARGPENKAQLDHLKLFPDEIPGRTEVSLGWAYSPLFTYSSEATLTENKGQFKGTLDYKRSSGFHINVLSWSAATLAFAVLLFVAAWWRRANPAGTGNNVTSSR